MTAECINSLLAPIGLQVLGYCPTETSDGLAYDGTIALIGPNEPAFWPIFSQSPEFTDDAPNPLDRWSRRVLNHIAADLNATALFPFGGAPFLPFFTWAKRSGRFWGSPINFLVHDAAGLFASFRGAILLHETIERPAATQPCLTCAAPCKTACPVGAFGHGYDVATCKAHLSTPEGADCMTSGCRARRACPVGQNNRLPAQAAFHMKAFL